MYIFSPNTLIRSAEINANFTELKKPAYTESAPTSITPNIDSYEMFALFGLTATLTINPPIGTPANNQNIIFRLKDNGTIRTLSWNAIYRAIGVTIPTATVANKTFYIGCKYNEQDIKWDVISVTREA